GRRTGQAGRARELRIAAWPRELFRQRIGPDLDMHRAWFGALAAFHQPGCAVAARTPEPAAFPACAWIVNSAVEALGKEAERIGNAQHDHLPVLEGDEAIVEVGGGDWNVLAEADRVVMIDPGVVARLRDRDRGPF